MTVVERNNGAAHVFIGSPNATGPAYGGNVEAAVELVGRASRLGVATIIGDDAPLRAYLQPYRRAELVNLAEEQAREALKKVVRNLAAVPMQLRVEPDADRWALHLTSDKSLPLPDGFTGNLALLTIPGKGRPLTPTTVDVRFTGVTTPDVTPFVAITVTDSAGRSLGTVVHAPLTNDPPHRLDEVLARQVDSPEKFLRFLALLLGLGSDSFSTVSPDVSVTPGWGPTASAEASGLLEDVVVALAANPEALAGLDGLLEQLLATEAGRAVIPPGFEELWANVCEAREVLGLR